MRVSIMTSNGRPAWDQALGGARLIRRIGQGLLALLVASITDLPALADPPTSSPTASAADANRILPDNGWWWAASEPGRGYSIEAKLGTGTAFVAAFVYDSAGKATWYAAVLTAQLSDVVSQGFYGPFSISTPLTGDLYQYSGGQTLTGAFKSAAGTKVGAETLTFTGQTTGKIDWPASITTRQTAITRYPINGSTIVSRASNIVPQSGWWYAASQGGRGYFLEVQGSQAFFAGYMYRADGTPVWYVAGPTAMTTPSSLTANLVEVANGPTFANPTVNNGVSTTTGTMTATFASATTGSLVINGGTPIAITRYTLF